MYNILVVDDELYAREFICEYLNDRFMNIFRVFSASSAYNAMKIIMENVIHIVITDIRMPGMSGLDLANFINSEYPDISVIITTGYEEFEYAKSAIKYNVTDYLVKPFELSELETVLRNEVKKLEKKSENNFANIDSLHEEREIFFVNLFYGDSTNQTVLAEEAKKLAFPFDIFNTPCDIIALKISGYDEYIKKKWNYTKDSLKTVLYNVLSGFIKTDYIFCTHVSDGYFEYIVYHTQNVDTDYELISKNINDILKLPIAIYKKGKTFDNINELIKGRRNYEDTDEEILMFFTYIEENRFREAKKIFKAISSDNNCIPKFLEMLASINVNISIDEFEKEKNNTEELFEKISYMIEVRTNKYNKLMERAKKYIHENFNKNISREDVANHVFFSSAHFTRSFKQYTGENFNDYLLRIRMETAIELMRKNKYKIYEIAKKTGYENPKYFFKVFKLYTGYSPKDYISKFLSKEDKI